MDLQRIDIDFDIHRKIENERRGFDEPPYMALRRLLGLPEKAVETPGDDSFREGVPFVEDGVSILHGSDARMRYLRGTQLYEGKFLDGMLVVGDKKYPTLSAAASDLARTKEGKKTSLNGWLYWEMRAPGTARWRMLKDLREQAQHQLEQVKKWV